MRMPIKQSIHLSKIRSLQRSKICPMSSSTVTSLALTSPISFFSSSSTFSKFISISSYSKLLYPGGESQCIFLSKLDEFLYYVSFDKMPSNSFFNKDRLASGLRKVGMFLRSQMLIKLVLPDCGRDGTCNGRDCNSCASCMSLVRRSSRVSNMIWGKVESRVMGELFLQKLPLFIIIQQYKQGSLLVGHTDGMYADEFTVAKGYSSDHGLSFIGYYYFKIGYNNKQNYKYSMGCGASTSETTAPVIVPKPAPEQKKQVVQPPKDNTKSKQQTPKKQQLKTSKVISPSKSAQETPRNPEKSPDKKLTTEQTTQNNLASSTKTINSPSKIKLDIHPVDEKPELKKTIHEDKDKKKIKKKKAAEDKKLSQLIRVYEL